MQRWLIELDFLKSALNKTGKFKSTGAVLEWISEQNRRVEVNINKIPLEKVDGWTIDGKSMRHQSGQFFSIVGIDVKTNWSRVHKWMQPVINQPEIGYLGFIVKKFDGVFHFLVQAKIEPGNVNNVQLSPTLQATRSNYTRVHKGRPPAYLEYFQKIAPENVLLDQLQSEQGARFLKKRNRNMIIYVENDLPVLDNFVWLTLGQIKELLYTSNIVNMDTRTVISGIPLGPNQLDQSRHFESFFEGYTASTDISSKILKSHMENSGALNSYNDIIQFITRLKTFYDLDVNMIDLCDVNCWHIEEMGIRHEEDKFFRVIGAQVSINNREVVNWSQPMVEPAQDGICAFVCKEINGTIHLAVQAKLECGNFDIIELAPTVQCLTGNYKNDQSISRLPFLEYVLNAKPEQIILDTLQSEEGGRFYREQNRNMLVLADDELSVDLPDNYIWMTLNQLQFFVRFNNYINIQARSLLAAMPLPEINFDN